MVGERLLLDRDLPRVRAVHHAVAAGILLGVVEGATPGGRDIKNDVGSEYN